MDTLMYLTESAMRNNDNNVSYTLASLDKIIIAVDNLEKYSYSLIIDCSFSKAFNELKNTNEHSRRDKPKKYKSH